MRFRIVDEVLAQAVPHRARDRAAGDERRRQRGVRAAQWLAELSRQYLQLPARAGAVPEIETVGLDALTNALIMSLNLDVEEKQRLLEIDDLDRARGARSATSCRDRIESLQFLAPFRHGGDPSRN